ncbi:CDP-alcohol phosphatidyltransferase family protein [Azohydromonas caseinilytica]|uniref:CDP-alcohol phosphatidyltransferase family protein n=1 Tax=Azohydromonas caseinilytica TaxID=2728836 RepID=A0A848FH50_9BURK|nr:CDP-alcohol phosphatidyltransferase family protein [Azohydromonas caseinilytica]NML18466.1 CDP-alcohol phosphatidyltransferase family protein [Azohydromonas caseinilytica]
MTSPISGDRRELRVRGTAWARALARALAARGVSPNQISVLSIAFAAAGAAALWAGGWWTLAAAACIQGRLLCNLFDGMVAVEHGRQTALGVIYNEFPDRIADSLLIVAAGHACGWPALGWFGALAAALTAYVRVFGAACGQGHDFRGPMAKQHRMALLTAAGLLQPFVTAPWPLRVAVAAIAAGSVLTCATRTHALARRLRAAGTP